MIKKGSYILGLTILVAVISSVFISLDEKKVKGFHLAENEVIQYTVVFEVIVEEVVEVSVPHL